ncbi:MAG: hypothetical protein V2A65_10185 [Candidatus Omnitrophota bacterium]
MWRKSLFLGVVLSLVLMFAGYVRAEDPEAEIKVLKAQVQGMMQRIEKLEKELTGTKEAKAGQPVTLSTAGSELTIKGRVFIGYYDSERFGSTYENGSFEMPDAKVQLTWKPWERIEVVNRFNLNNAAFNSVDYCYLQGNQIIPGDEKSRVRIGRTKIDFGEETWSNNPVEGRFISNSAANVTGYDDGIELYGNFIPDTFGYYVDLANGNTGTGSDNTSSKSIAAKIFGRPVKPWYLSASYYTSGDLDNNNSEMTIAGGSTAPTGSTDWQRNIWEFNTKLALGPAEFAGVYGQFEDDATDVTDRQGEYYFIQAVFSITPKTYAGLRYSTIKLDDGVTSTLNSVSSADQYDRTSFVLGYKFSKLITVKTEYSWNDNHRPGKASIDDNQFAIGVATQF